MSHLPVVGLVLRLSNELFLSELFRSLVCSWVGSDDFFLTQRWFKAPSCERKIKNMDEPAYDEEYKKRFSAVLKRARSGDESVLAETSGLRSSDIKAIEFNVKRAKARAEQTASTEEAMEEEKEEEAVEDEHTGPSESGAMDQDDQLAMLEEWEEQQNTPPPPLPGYRRQGAFSEVRKRVGPPMRAEEVKKTRPPTKTVDEVDAEANGNDEKVTERAERGPNKRTIVTDAPVSAKRVKVSDRDSAIWDGREPCAQLVGVACFEALFAKDITPTLDVMRAVACQSRLPCNAADSKKIQAATWTWLQRWLNHSKERRVDPVTRDPRIAEFRHAILTKHEPLFDGDIKGGLCSWTCLCRFGWEDEIKSVFEALWHLWRQRVCNRSVLDSGFRLMTAIEARWDFAAEAAFRKEHRVCWHPSDLQTNHSVVEAFLGLDKNAAVVAWLRAHFHYGERFAQRRL